MFYELIVHLRMIPCLLGEEVITVIHLFILTIIEIQVKIMSFFYRAKYTKVFEESVETIIHGSSSFLKRQT
jgi:hypothetical protein